MSTTTEHPFKLTVDAHRDNLHRLRDEVAERTAKLQEGYEELTGVGVDVGSGDDEGGSEADGSAVERDRLRAQLNEEGALLDAITAALVRAESPTWKDCRTCGKPIGDERLDALPTAELCVTCKANAPW